MFVFIIIDLLVTGCVMLRHSNRLEGKEATNIIEKLCDQYADDEYVRANKYPDLKWITYDRFGKEKVHYHYALREIIQATNIGVMEGYPKEEGDPKDSSGKFKPDEPIIRCEFIKMLVSLATNKNFDFV